MSTIVPSSEHAERARKLATLVRAKGADGALITSPHAIHYYSGFETTGYYLPHALLAGGDGIHLVVRDFEEGNEHAGATSLHLWDTHKDFGTALGEIAGTLSAGACTLLYEDNSNFLQPQVMDHLRERRGLRLIPTGRELSQLRTVKSQAELQCSRKAGATAVKGLTAGLNGLVPGVSEREASITMLRAMIASGGEFPASLPYAYFGVRSWRRMQQPGAAQLRADEPFYLECGGSASRYAAATLRSGFAGKAPDAYRDLYATALDCFLALEAAIRPGATSVELDAIGSQVIAKAGFTDLRLSKFGYSIGIAFSPGWGEASAFDIDPQSQATVEEKMVIHLVSTLMSPQWGTVGLSETMEVTSSGCASITPSGRSLIELV